jgi:hypothetical protein
MDREKEGEVSETSAGIDVTMSGPIKPNKTKCLCIRNLITPT